jgi:hypothetical protein
LPGLARLKVRDRLAALAYIDAAGKQSNERATVHLTNVEPGASGQYFDFTSRHNEGPMRIMGDIEECFAFFQLDATLGVLKLYLNVGVGGQTNVRTVHEGDRTLLTDTGGVF